MSLKILKVKHTMTHLVYRLYCRRETVGQHQEVLDPTVVCFRPAGCCEVCNVCFFSKRFVQTTWNCLTLSFQSQKGEKTWKTHIRRHLIIEQPLDSLKIVSNCPPAALKAFQLLSTDLRMEWSSELIESRGINFSEYLHIKRPMAAVVTF